MRVCNLVTAIVSGVLACCCAVRIDAGQARSVSDMRSVASGSFPFLDPSDGGMASVLTSARTRTDASEYGGATVAIGREPFGRVNRSRNKPTTCSS